MADRDERRDGGVARVALDDCPDDPGLLAGAAPMYTEASPRLTTWCTAMRAASVDFADPRGRHAAVSRSGPKWARAMVRWNGARA